MPCFTLTAKAKADMLEIGRYTLSRWGREQRDKYLTMLDDCFQQLAADPLMGKDCSEIRSGYRKYRAGSHVIFYRQRLNDTIEIVRVLHGRMDMDSHLTEPKES
ncbi:MAG TPA: type II toxin-antitoxin system RelE/ParE family toxin [Desulfuromonadales bacterium]|nr:type II toxin-antitoxin system RelE/ParE family toxin [Desulfuromonadales bacterium]